PGQVSVPRRSCPASSPIDAMPAASVKTRCSVICLELVVIVETTSEVRDFVKGAASLRNIHDPVIVGGRAVGAVDLLRHVLQRGDGCGEQVLAADRLEE